MTLIGGKGNDSLYGGAGNDTLTGNDGSDIFIYESGKDVIAGFTAGQNKIKIASGKISKSSLSGSDVIFTIGKGSLTVKNVKGKTISLLDSTEKASSTVVGAQSLSNSNKASVSIGADMSIVDASKRTKAIKITGNALANSISGGSKNDSIYGATLVSTHLFMRAATVKMFSSALRTMICFKSPEHFPPATAKKKGEIYFKVDSTSNAITLKDFSATVFNVNGTAYKISGSKLTKK